MEEIELVEDEALGSKAEYDQNENRKDDVVRNTEDSKVALSPLSAIQSVGEAGATPSRSGAVG